MNEKKARIYRKIAKQASTLDEAKPLRSETNYLQNEKGQVILGACVRKIYQLMKKEHKNEKEI